MILGAMLDTGLPMERLSVNLAACGVTLFDRVNKIFFYFYPEYPV
jgi:hypothetical protein